MSSSNLGVFRFISGLFRFIQGFSETADYDILFCGHFAAVVSRCVWYIVVDCACASGRVVTYMSAQMRYGGSTSVHARVVSDRLRHDD